MKKLAMLAVLVMSGCSSMTGAPAPTTGWLFQIGSPSVVHVPVINTQTTGGVSTTGVGSHWLQQGATVQPSAPPAVVPAPLPPLPLPMPKTVSGCATE